MTTPVARTDHLASNRARTSALAILGLTVVAGVGCRGSDGPPPVEVVAIAGGDTLTAERLSNWLVLGQPLPVTEAVAEGLAAHWVEMATVAAADPGRLRTPQAAQAVMWPALRASRVERYLSASVATEPPTPAEVGGAYEGDRWRLAAHILRRAAPEAHPEERARQREAAGRIRTALTRGTPWEEAVRQSEDGATLPRNGLLGLVERGRLADGLDQTVFTLRPGEISIVVETLEGYHIVYRPRLQDVRPIFRDLLQEEWERAARADHVSELEAELHLSVDPDAGDRLRRLASGGVDNPTGDATGGGMGGGAPLATWDGGSLGDSVAVRYLGTLDETARRQLVDATAAEADTLLTDIAGQELLWSVVTQDGAPDDDARRDEILSDFDATVRSIYEALGADDLDAAPGVGTVDPYMEAVVSRRRDPVAVPPALPAWLRNGPAAELRMEGVRAAVDRAARLLRSADAEEGS